MDVKASREALGVSQRELAKRTGLSQAKLSRIESGDRQATSGDLALIAVALEMTVQTTTLDPPPKKVPESRAVKDIEKVRRVFVCQKCRERVALRMPGVRIGDEVGEPASYVPECPEHGPMVRQMNMPYRGVSKEPPAAWGWPKAVDNPKVVLGMRAALKAS